MTKTNDHYRLACFCIETHNLNGLLLRREFNTKTPTTPNNYYTYPDLLHAIISLMCDLYIV